jgi:hypothetical protein
MKTSPRVTKGSPKHKRGAFAEGERYGCSKCGYTQNRSVTENELSVLRGFLQISVPPSSTKIPIPIKEGHVS